MSDDLLERLRPSYELLSANRYDEWLALLHPEVVCRQSPTIFDTAGEFHGHSGAIAMMTELNEAWDTLTWEPVEARDLGGGRYLVRVHVSPVGRESRIPIGGNQVVHLVTVKDGLTTRIDILREWEEGLRAAGAE